MLQGSDYLKDLTPEQQRAHFVISEAMPRWKQLFYSPSSDCILHTDFLAFYNQPFQLPPQKTWTWNQSCGKNTFTLRTDDEIEVVMYKMNSRKKRNVASIPSYKVWLFQFGKKGNRPHLYAIWCEKGYPDKLDGVLSLPSSEDLSLQDFSFLKQFVNQDLAREFGWISPQNE